VSTLTIDLYDETAFSDDPEHVEADPTLWQLDQRMLGNYSSGRFRTSVAQETTLAGSSVRLKVEGITPHAVLAIIGGRLNDGPLEALKIVVPHEASLDGDVYIPPDAEGGTYIFCAQQWAPGQPAAYVGGSLIYISKTASVKVQPQHDDAVF
jgi:hypothetical protein